MKITQFWVVDIGTFNNIFGDADLFLLDYILKGRLSKEHKIVDAGCGSGRNLFHFLRAGFEVSGFDKSESEVRAANLLSRNLVGREVCKTGRLQEIPFDPQSFDFAVCSQVLHFADSEEDFFHMLDELKRILARAGVLYLSMASQIGLEKEVKKIGGGHFRFPDGVNRFTLRKDLLKEIERAWEHVETPKTVIFGGDHAETTLVIKPR